MKSIYLNHFQSDKDTLLGLLIKNQPRSINISNVTDYHDSILFILNHPKSTEIKTWANAQLIQITQWCLKHKVRLDQKHYNTGLPHTKIYSFFSWELLQWLSQQNIMNKITDYDQIGVQLNDVLNLSLLPNQVGIIEQELNNEELLKHFGINNSKLDSFIRYHFNKISHLPRVARRLFDAGSFTVEVELDPKENSIAWNKIKIENTYFHQDWLKKFDTKELISKEIELKELETSNKKELESVIKRSLMVLQRETEPVTYMDPESLRLIHLERGIQIALFTMKLEQQLPYESYVGYTLFKNGYPAAYGGAWILGKHALIGLNIFEWCRGGESSYFFAQLLRAYHQVFKVSVFEVEPYQYGKDNPEGIESGAFWFYYKMGFRPTNKTIANIANVEYKKFQKNKKYKTPKSILRTFTESEISLELDKSKPIRISEINEKLLKYQQKANKNTTRPYGSFEQMAFESIITNIKPDTLSVINYTDVYTEYGMLALCMGVDLKQHTELMHQLIANRIKDVYAYQRTWRKIFNT